MCCHVPLCQCLMVCVCIEYLTIQNINLLINLINVSYKLIFTVITPYIETYTMIKTRLAKFSLYVCYRMFQKIVWNNCQLISTQNPSKNIKYYSQNQIKTMRFYSNHVSINIHEINIPLIKKHVFLSAFRCKKTKFFFYFHINTSQSQI